MIFKTTRNDELEEYCVYSLPSTTYMFDGDTIYLTMEAVELMEHNNDIRMPVLIRVNGA